MLGASTWASGSQVWRGKMGTLMAKASAKAAKTRSPGAKQAAGRRHQRSGLEKIEIAVRPDAGLLVVEPGKIEDRHQHEDRSRHGEDEELDRSVDAAGTSPDADDEVHRDQGDLPEDIEQEEIEGDKGADHPGGQSRKVMWSDLMCSILSDHAASTTTGRRRVVSSTSRNETPSTPTW